MALYSMALVVLVGLTLAQGQERTTITPPPDCSGPVPLYLRYPHTYLYHLRPDHALSTLIAKPFPKIDDGWFRERWTPKFIPSPMDRNTGVNGTIEWVLREAQGEAEAASGDTSGWRHHPEVVPSIPDDLKQKYIQDGIKYQKGVQELEKLQYQMKLYLGPDSPSFRHQKGFTYTYPEATKRAYVGYIMDAATSKLKTALHIPKVTDLQLVSEKKLCAQLGSRPDPVTCDKNAKYRTLDGTCNNLFHENYGASFIPFRRLVPHEYGDGVSSPRLAKDGSELPSARRVSFGLKAFSQRISSCFSAFQMSFGQFIDHDFTATPTVKGLNGSAITCCDERVLQDPSLRHPQCFPIAIPHDDPFYSVYGVTCMEFVRSIPADRCHFGPREQINQLTAYLDGSALYGSTEKQADALREFKGGLLKMQLTREGYELLPITKGDEDDCNDATENSQGRYCFHAGDARVNEHLLLTLITTMFAREHNRLAKELARQHPSWSDEKLYHESKRIVAAQIQHVTYNEFLSGVLGPQLVKALELKPAKGDTFYTGYDDKINPGVSSEFSTAAFRFGHSMIPTHFYEKDSTGKYSASEINNVIFHPFHMYDRDGMGKVLQGALSQSVGMVDQAFTSQITGKLFKKNKHLGLDLVAINFQRGRDHGVGGYVKVRQACGFPPVKSFEDLAGVFSSDTLTMVRKLYRHVEDIDLFLGGMSEHPLPGGLVGPTMACIIADQFIRAKRGDRFWYENEGQPGSFTADQLQVLHNVSAARLICDNFPEVRTIQRWPLQLVGAHNPVLPCDSLCLPTFDLTPWKSVP